MVLTALTQTTLTAQQSKLASFEIDDQFGRVHRDFDYQGRVLVMIGSDREGSVFYDRWESVILRAVARGNAPS